MLMPLEKDEKPVRFPPEIVEALQHFDWPQPMPAPAPVARPARRRWGRWVLYGILAWPLWMLGLTLLVAALRMGVDQLVGRW